jgi:hypothetical protein
MKTVRISISIPSKGGTGEMGFNDFFYGKDKGYNEVFTSNTRSIRVKYLPIGRYQVSVTCVDGWYENERTIELDLPSFKLVIELCVLIDPVRDGMGDSVIVHDDRVAISLDGVPVVESNICNGSLIGEIDSTSTVEAYCDKCNIWRIKKKEPTVHVLILNVGDKKITIQFR